MEWEQKTLISELTQGRELANQLKNRLDSSSSPQSCEFLLKKILSSYEKALSVLNWSDLLKSPNSMGGSTQSSEYFDNDSKDQCPKYVFKKRKVSSPTWSQQVRVCSGTALEGSLDDGFTWRKYGQKQILGATFPRAYYRCTHRDAQGCLATKQVQKSDKDSFIFEVTYRGKHTCVQSSHLSKGLASQEKRTPEEIKYQIHTQNEDNFQKNTDEMIKKFDTSEEIFTPFSFPSTPIATENMESHFFSEYANRENNFTATYSPPPFISPATTGSNYLMNRLGVANHLQSSDSDIADIISAPTSVTNSPIDELDFSLDSVDFDSNLSFDIVEFFS